MSKPRILIVSDSAFLDTGFARVAREIGTGLVCTGKYEVAQLGIFHKPTDRMVPFHVFPVHSRDPDRVFGQKAMVEVVPVYKPDIVLTIHEYWAIDHVAAYTPRTFKLVSYLPIDGVPISPSWIPRLETVDKLVLYGKFGQDAVRRAMPKMDTATIPHGVDLGVFRPMSPEDRLVARSRLQTDTNNKFIIGCVARNNERKMLPRLLKAFAQFIRAWASCRRCGHILHTSQEVVICAECGGDQFATGAPKDDAILYLHCSHSDRAGHDLLSLIRRFNLRGRVAMPGDMIEEGVGCPDAVLAQLYSTFDVFTLPTGGEGFGLPVLEAMACGLPCLVTDYSGHLDFCHGVAELITVNDWITRVHNSAEHAIVDIEDYVMKLDRFYYEKDQFLAKWGVKLMAAGAQLEKLDAMSYGRQIREELGQLAHARAQEYTWASATQQWDHLLDGVLSTNHSEQPDDERSSLIMETI